MIDLHSHVLYGIDDGPATIEGSVALARAAAAAGTRTLLATPHVSWHYPNDAATITPLVAAVNERLAGEQVDLMVLGGAEIAMTRLLEPRAGTARSTDAGGGDGSWSSRRSRRWRPAWTRWCSTSCTVAGVCCWPIPSAAPRCTVTPTCSARWSGAGVLTSITAGSFAGRFGGEVRRFALQLVREGLVHNVASDAHDEVKRPPGIAAELEGAGLGPLVPWLTEDVPAAILSGGEIPARPDVGLPGTEQGEARRVEPAEPLQASFVTAMIIPARTTTTIAI